MFLKRAVLAAVCLVLLCAVGVFGSDEEQDMQNFSIEKALHRFVVLMERVNSSLEKAKNGAEAAAAMQKLVAGTKRLEQQLMTIGEKRRLAAIFQGKMQDPAFQQWMMRYVAAAQKFALLLQQNMMKYAMDPAFQQAMTEYNRQRE